MTTSRKRLLIIACILFLIFGLLGIFTAITAFPYLAEYDRAYTASLPWAVYYGVVLIGSVIYLLTGICGFIYRKKPDKYILLRKLCIGALVYIFVGTILWFRVYAGVYDEHIAIAFTEIILGLLTCLILLFSISGQGSQHA